MQNPFEYFFGKSQNAPVVELLIKQAAIAASCAQALKESNCRAFEKVGTFEHEGDATEEHIHEILDSAFILRFDKSDITNLAQNLDNILDGMRHITTHVNTYAPYLQEFRPEAGELLDVIVDMTTTVAQLVPLLKDRRISAADIRAHVRTLAKSEARGDAIRHKAERELVQEQTGQSNAIAFLAHDRLIQMLEHVTDVANHCGAIILSIARKEA